VAVSPVALGQFAATGTTNITVGVQAEAAIQVDTATTPLTSTGLFADFTGTTNFTYKIRTTRSTGTGKITAQVTKDFVGATGGSGPKAADNVLTYGCTVSSPATQCTGPVTAATAETNVATFAANARSAKAGNSGSVGWTLVNDPQYEVDSYSAEVTFSISAI
jgi:hypothetical protein